MWTAREKAVAGGKKWQVNERKMLCSGQRKAQGRRRYKDPLGIELGLAFSRLLLGPDPMLFQRLLVL